MKTVLKKFLSFLATAYIKKYEPVIIAVTGNVGKTSAKEAIGAVIGTIKNVRVGKGNLNNEFGVPLTILGDWSEKYYNEGSGFSFWIRVLFEGVWGLIFNSVYPDVLVLEYGADHPGDIEKLAHKYKPHIAVVTAIGEIPVHVEYFSGPESVAREKTKLVGVLAPTDFAVLNFDDLAVLEMKEKTKARVLTFGFGPEATVRVSNLDTRIENGLPTGVGFKINYSDSFVPVKLFGSLGKSQGYTAGAAATVGIVLGMNLVDISVALSNYEGPKGRLKILKGIKNSVIIDDTYNSSPASMHLALETLNSFPGARKLAVLGDMLELGKYTIKAHQEAGNIAGTFVDLLVGVGSRAKFIVDAAANQIPKENIYIFETSDEAKLKVKELIEEGDLILIKGSQGMRMEKIVEEIIAEPEKKKELLVRQSKKWLAKP